MTTVCWDGITLAADTQATVSDMCAHVPSKIFRTTWKGRPALLGMAGSRQTGLAVVAWLDAGADESKRPLLTTDNECIFLVVTDEGAFTLEWRLIEMPVVEGFFAIGSGRDYALGAMYAGKSAREACEIAAVFDIHSSGPFTELTLAPQDGR